VARQPVKKSIRFEVFKRDSFTCQYCGQKAPDVVLEIDHITPVADGGDNAILNLLTACRACNAGKSDKALSDSAAVQKARAQAEDLEERRQQLEMIANWHLSLVDIESQASAQLERLWLEAVQAETGTYLLEHARDEIRRWSKRYGYERVCQAIVKAANSLLSAGIEQDQEERSAAFWSIPKICGVMRAEDNDPGVGRLFYIRGILRNRCAYLNERACIALLKEARDVGIDPEWMVEFAKHVSSWSAFRDTVNEHIRERYNENEEATDGSHPQH
jgi:hypothetical protein